MRNSKCAWLPSICGTVNSKDTNPLPFRSLCAILGVSATRNFVMNSVTVPRLPAEAVGGICKLKDLEKLGPLGWGIGKFPPPSTNMTG